MITYQPIAGLSCLYIDGITVALVEGNEKGRIVKVTERRRDSLGSRETVTVTYVRHSPTRLVEQAKRGEKGWFTSEKVAAPMICPASVATGWMFAATHAFLSEARLALGINTAPKRPAAIARALALAEAA